MSSTNTKIERVREKNTFFIKALPEDEEKYQNLIANIVSSLKELRNIVKSQIDTNNPDEQKLLEILANFLHSRKYGLDAALTICGLSYEKLYRILSFFKAAYKKGIYKSKSEWLKEILDGEWREKEIKSRLMKDYVFALDLSRILIGDEPLINDVLTPFERRALDPRNFLFLDDTILDTLARYSLHGSYSASKGKAPEKIIKGILDEMGVKYESGRVKGIGRKIDIIIPSKNSPKVFIQCSFVETTSSGMGDKAKAERDTVANNIKQNYPNAKFIIFVDGAGWLVREEALSIICEAGDYVFTFHEEHLEEFKRLLSSLLSKEDYSVNLRKFFKK